MVSPRMHLSKWLVLIISIISTISHGHARARILVSNEVTGFDKPKGAVKTIKSYETNEVIDCVDIFKQPAFDHPLLKNHTIQMKPSSYGKANGAGHGEGALRQVWWKYGKCPEGTIPIRRPQNHTNRHVKRLASHSNPLNSSENDLPRPIHEYAIVTMRGGEYVGAEATINVWNPTVVGAESSISQIWLISGPDEDMNTVEVGWIVNQFESSRGMVKLFVYWTSDGYRNTGCYDLECPGFVQTNTEIALGSLIEPISTYGGPQYDINIGVTKDEFTGRWWLRVGDVGVGYWPYEIYTYLKGPANRVDWGGEVHNTEPGGSHTPTQMGSGHFPEEGFGRASFFRNLKYVDGGYMVRDPENLVTFVSRPECYGFLFNVDPPDQYGVNFYYGGPGFSPQCAK